MPIVVPLHAEGVIADRRPTIKELASMARRYELVIVCGAPDAPSGFTAGTDLIANLRAALPRFRVVPVLMDQEVVPEWLAESVEAGNLPVVFCCPADLDASARRVKEWVGARRIWSPGT